jgi:hypothetical protein
MAKINVGLMAKVFKRVQREPKNFDMGVFIDPYVECGTTACIAGWACLESKDSLEEQTLLAWDFENRTGVFSRVGWQDYAISLLESAHPFSQDVVPYKQLFFTEDWCHFSGGEDSTLQHDYLESSKKYRPEVIRKVFRAFIGTYGDEAQLKEFDKLTDYQGRP